MNVNSKLSQDGKKNKKRFFSVKYKLMLIFGLLTVAIVGTLTAISMNIARKAVMERVEIQLKGKAIDISKLVDRSVKGDFNELKTIGDMLFNNTSLDCLGRAELLKKESKSAHFLAAYEVDLNGIAYYSDDGVLKEVDVSDRKYFHAAIKGKSYISEPINSKLTNELIITVAVPVYDDKNKMIAILTADFDGLSLCKYIEDIVVGKTGAAYMIGQSGITIADPEPEYVEQKLNTSERAKTDESFKTVAKFEQRSLSEKEPAVDYFEWKGVRNIASFAKVPSTGWAVIIMAPSTEFLDTIDTMRYRITVLSTFMIIISIVVIFLVSRLIVKPLKVVTDALKNISRGDGDLTVRIPINGNDEVTSVAKYFNETINKINMSIKSVMNNTGNMDKIGQTLASNMTETASSINEISAILKA